MVPRTSGMRSGRIWPWVLVLAIGLRIACFAQDDDDRFNQVGWLKGRVTIVNHPNLGRTPATGMYFVLQRVDCKRCLIGVRADIDGTYSVTIGSGRYRVYCEDPYRKDLLRKGQAREVMVKPGGASTAFDIELEVAR